jgi:hypothetical protein
VIIVDDPLNAVNAYSATEREKVNHWFDTALLSRLDSPATGVVIVVMQRLHEDDLTGHLLEKGGWKEMSLPARNIDADRYFSLMTGGSHLWSAGADLMPTRLSAIDQAGLRASMGEAAFSAQYLQRPVPLGGAIVKGNGSRPMPSPRREVTCGSWSTATTSPRSRRRRPTTASAWSSGLPTRVTISSSTAAGCECRFQTFCAWRRT